MPHIYTITVFELKTDPQSWRPRSRTWGWYGLLEDAELAVVSNEFDMYEMGYYSIALIEKVSEGIGSYSKDRWWYKSTYVSDNPDVYHVEKTAEPEWAKNTFGFSMG